jgi:hypothetical protein
MSTSPLNSFEALCELASKENWCWNLWCTTCGHVQFRYAFLELAAGKSPMDNTWIVKDRKNRYSGYSSLLGKMPKDYDQIQREKITKICLDADLSRISRSCKFPDWLGYLGLVLHHMNASPLFFKLCESWAGQLSQLMPPDSDAYARLNDLSKGNGTLGVSDLEVCERELKKIV